MMNGIILDRGSLSIPTLGDHEQFRTGANDLHTQHFGISLNIHATHTLRIATHRAYFFFIPLNRLTSRRDHHDLFAGSNALDGNELIAIFQTDSDQAITTGTVVKLHGGLLHHATGGCEHEIFVFREILRSDDC